MSHVLSCEEFRKWRQQSGDGPLAEHLKRRKNSMKLSSVIVICSTHEGYQEVANYIHDYELHNCLQIENI